MHGNDLIDNNVYSEFVYELNNPNYVREDFNENEIQDKKYFENFLKNRVGIYRYNKLSYLANDIKNGKIYSASFPDPSKVSVETICEYVWKVSEIESFNLLKNPEATYENFVKSTKELNNENEINLSHNDDVDSHYDFFDPNKINTLPDIDQKGKKLEDINLIPVLQNIITNEEINASKNYYENLNAFLKRKGLEKIDYHDFGLKILDKNLYEITLEEANLAVKKFDGIYLSIDNKCYNLKYDLNNGFQIKEGIKPIQQSFENLSLLANMFKNKPGTDGKPVPEFIEFADNLTKLKNHEGNEEMLLAKTTIAKLKCDFRFNTLNDKHKTTIATFNDQLVEINDYKSNYNDVNEIDFRYLKGHAVKDFAKLKAYVDKLVSEESNEALTKSKALTRLSKRINDCNKNNSLTHADFAYLKRQLVDIKKDISLNPNFVTKEIQIDQINNSLEKIEGGLYDFAYKSNKPAKLDLESGLSSLSDANNKDSKAEFYSKFKYPDHNPNYKKPAFSYEEEMDSKVYESFLKNRIGNDRYILLARLCVDIKVGNIPCHTFANPETLTDEEICEHVWKVTEAGKYRYTVGVKPGVSLKEALIEKTEQMMQSFRQNQRRNENFASVYEYNAKSQEDAVPLYDANRIFNINDPKDSETGLNIALAPSTSCKNIANYYEAANRVLANKYVVEPIFYYDDQFNQINLQTAKEKIMAKNDVYVYRGGDYIIQTNLYRPREEYKIFQQNVPLYDNNTGKYTEMLDELNKGTYFFIRSSKEYRDMRNILKDLINHNGNEIGLIDKLSATYKKYASNYENKTHTPIANKRKNCADNMYNMLTEVISNYKKYDSIHAKIYGCGKVQIFKDISNIYNQTEILLNESKFMDKDDINCLRTIRSDLIEASHRDYKISDLTKVYKNAIKLERKSKREECDNYVRLLVNDYITSIDKTYRNMVGTGIKVQEPEDFIVVDPQKMPGEENNINANNDSKGKNIILESKEDINENANEFDDEFDLSKNNNDERKEMDIIGVVDEEDYQNNNDESINLDENNINNINNINNNN